jgi:hypothetical protein
MTPQERIARAQRAERALEEFITPILTECRETYTARIIELAATELNPNKRRDKITALATAVRVLDAIENGIQAVILDGQMATKDKLRAEKIERMTPPERRIFNLIPTA